MTLHRQLTIFIVLLFVALLLGTLTLNLHNTRNFLEEQLSSHAQDTATSLGLSLSPHIRDGDWATANSMIDAIFDRGYYRSIVITDLDGEPVVERRLPVRIEGVPPWLIEAVPLDTPEREAKIMAGWRQAGSVSVVSHPGYAYDVLWETARRMLFWFGGAALVVLALGIGGLRLILRPLKAVERQADAVRRRRYEVQDKLPRIRELRSVVAAMNRMTVKVKQTFEEQARTAERLRSLAFRDELTGLSNRRYFDAILAQKLDAAPPFTGAAIMISIDDLSEVNSRLGFQGGDALVRAVATELGHVAGQWDEAFCARLSGADFMLLLPVGDESALEVTLEQLSEALALVGRRELEPGASVGHIGAVWVRAGDDATELLSRADNALRMAGQRGPNGWALYTESEAAQREPSRTQWRELIEEVLHEERIELHRQWVKTLGSEPRTLHGEVFARIEGEADRFWQASQFLPMAEQLDVVARLDLLVLRKLLGGSGSGTGAAGGCYALNISPASLRHPEFVDQVVASLRQHPPGSAEAHLIFEFSEFGVVHQREALHAFATRVREFGHDVGLDHFGRSFADFGYLYSLKPEYVKLDAGYMERIVDSQHEQFFVTALRGVAHSVDVDVIAVAVETAEQQQVLAGLNIDGVQGYAVGRPEPLPA